MIILHIHPAMIRLQQQIQNPHIIPSFDQPMIYCDAIFRVDGAQMAHHDFR